MHGLVCDERMTAEDATAQYVRQENKLARLQSRFDQRGLVLGLKFRWREAWKPRAKAEQGDLEWERACLLFDAGAALSYSAARAQARGARDGGLKEAVNKFQQAALALSRGILGDDLTRQDVVVFVEDYGF